MITDEMTKAQRANPRENSIWVDGAGRRYRVVFTAKALVGLRDPIWVIYQEVGGRQCLADSLPEWLQRMKPQAGDSITESTARALKETTP